MGHFLLSAEFNEFCFPLGVQDHLGTWYDDLNQILTLGDALGPEL